MQITASNKQNEMLHQFCQLAKQLILSGDYEKCHEMACMEICEYPDAPHPHNILGILLEKTGHHAAAMKHFRAALALDASYRPASQNLKNYGTFYSNGRCAFDEMDCDPEGTESYPASCDGHIVSHIVRGF